MAVFLILVGAGSLNAGNLLFAKLMGFAGAAGLQYYSSKNTYFYFRNAGYRVRQVIASALLVDVLLIILLITIYLEVR